MSHAPTEGHAPGPTPAQGHAPGSTPTQGHAPGSTPTPGHAPGSTPTQGHAPGSTPTPGHAPRATPAHRSEPLRPHPTRFVFLDTEATGLDLYRHELTEVAWIVRFEDGAEVEQQYFPEHTLDGADTKALELTAYHRRIAPQRRTPMSQWLPQFLDDARDAVIIGAVPDFDVRQMHKACRKLGLEPTWDHHLLDVETLALPLIAPGPEAPRSLARTCEALGVAHDEEQAHGALYDARQVRAVFDAVWRLIGDLRRAGKPLPPPVPRPAKEEEEEEEPAAVH
jgi:DNA polymerase III epsilon subunit-like protein